MSGVEFLNTMYRLDAEFLVRVEPKFKRPYKKQTSTSRRKSQEKVVQDTSKLEIRKGDIEAQMRAIANKTIVKLAESSKKAKRDYFKALREYREQNPIEEQDIETEAEYETMVKEATAKLKGDWDGAKQNVVAKEREHAKLKAEHTRIVKKLTEISNLAEYEEAEEDEEEEEEEDEVDPETPGGSVAMNEDGDEDDDDDDDDDEDLPSQTQLED